MSFCGGSYADHKKASGGLPAMLGPNVGAAEDTYGGFIPGEFFHITPPNARTQIMIDTPLGKSTGIFLGFMWQMRKKGFVVNKVSEGMEISPVHSQYYQLTIQQKQTLEGQIKSALAGVHTAISDYELISHDMRKYTEYMRYFEGLEEGMKTKNEDLIRRNNQTLKSLFIDQVDVHTGEGVALKLIASRWPTIIVDFMKIKDSDLDPKSIAKNYGFSEAEGVVLATKNKIFLQWRDLFKNAVSDRYKHLLELKEARKRSIAEYRNMVKPYIMRYKSIKELGESKGGREALKAMSWARPAAVAMSIDTAEYWMWRPFWPPELNRPSLQRDDNDVSIKDFDIPDYAKDELIKANDGKKMLKVFPTGIEPVDKWVFFFKDRLNEYYKKEEDFRSKVTTEDILKARKKIAGQFVEYGRWDWLPSPYFMCVEIDLMRIVQRNPDGTESETMIIGDYPKHPLMAIFNSQNAMIVRQLEIMLQEKELDRYISDMIGETVEGKELDNVIQEEYPYMSGKGKPKAKGREPFVTDKKMMDKTKLQKYIRFTRGGPYHTLFMERVAAMMLKEIGQSTYAYMVKYFKSAAGVP